MVDVHEKAKGRSVGRERGEQKGDTRDGIQETTRGRRKQRRQQEPQRRSHQKMGREVLLPVPHPQGGVRGLSFHYVTHVFTYHTAFSKLFCF